MGGIPTQLTGLSFADLIITIDLLSQPGGGRWASGTNAADRLTPMETITQRSRDWQTAVSNVNRQQVFQVIHAVTPEALL